MLKKVVILSKLLKLIRVFKFYKIIKFQDLIFFHTFNGPTFFQLRKYNFYLSGAFFHVNMYKKHFIQNILFLIKINYYKNFSEFLLEIFFFSMH